MASRYLFTFGFGISAKVLNNNSDDDPYVAVYATTYLRAVKKVLKLKLPFVETEEDLKFSSCAEELQEKSGGTKPLKEN